MTPTAAVLKAELAEIRETERGSLRAREAFEAWFAQACAEGNPPDRLRLYSPIETERYWARTIPGPDGHLFWAGGGSFSRNGGLTISPRRWAWVHRHGPIPPTDTVYVTCGERNCVAVEHLACERRTGLSQSMPPDQMTTNLQVIAARIGYTPTSKEWDRRKEKPCAATYRMKFGSWANAIAIAGLPDPPNASRFLPANSERCIESLRRLAEHLGHPPNGNEFGRCHEWLTANGLLSSPQTIRSYLGGWADALRKAGLS